MLLIVFAAWQFFYQSEIRAANEAGEYFQRRLCPKWVFLLCTVYLALTYSFSGMTKLWFHGPGWANGTSLQTWVIGADGWPPLAEFIRQNRTIAAWMQFAVLWAEALAIFAIWWRWPRLIIGLALIGFHLTSEVLFQYGFYGNIVAVAFLFIIPSIWSIEADSFLARINQQNSERKTPVQ